MPIVVQKYGGSSVADVAQIALVAERIIATRNSGYQVVVVVSAMGNTTNELLALARRVSPSPGRRELDMLISVGERISMALLSMAINDRGVPSVSFTGSQSGIITDEHHASARIIEVRPYRIIQALQQGKIAIVAGFQGVSRAREITTLGRGGSDTTAVALAAALGARHCEICSDVDGVYSADPHAIAQAVRISSLSYDEALTLFRGGARVLHAEAVAFAAKHGIDLHLRSTAQSAGGTTIASGEHAASRGPVAIAVDSNLLWLEPLPAENGLDELLAEVLQAGATIRSVRNNRILVDKSDLHVSSDHRWPSASVVRNVAVATVAGLGCGLVENLQKGSYSLRSAGLTVLDVQADADRLAWAVPADQAGAMQQILHRELLENSLPATSPPGIP